MLKITESLLGHINTILDNSSRSKINTITPEMNLRDDIGLDSFDLAELTVRLEMEYGIDVFEGGLVFTVAEVLKKLKLND
jgi:acyl carrier protein